MPGEGGLHVLRLDPVSFSAPEPTSAALLLGGGALLALRRRRSPAGA
ncbi:MAG: PEP-CTERM sorting domain-containing protein [Chthoniobacter sp.]|nr:PEP-CTERM sorting domain-containing protein [Chthoniobacter sp.]